MVPSVTITGLIERPSINSPLISPTAAPLPMPIATARGAPSPCARPMPQNVAEASTTEPTDRSMPPTSTTVTSARPSTSTEADWRRMLTALAGVPNTGAVAAKTRQSRTAANSMA
jgi:hypothetical protein